MAHSNSFTRQMKPKYVCHAKANVRDRRIRLPAACSEIVQELKRELGHRSFGETIEWLLNQSKDIVMDVIGKKSTPPPTNVTSILDFPNHPSHLAVVTTSMKTSMNEPSSAVAMMNQPLHHTTAVASMNQPSCDTVAMALMNQPSRETAAVTSMNQPSRNTVAMALMNQPSHHPAAATSMNQPSCDTVAMALMNQPSRNNVAMALMNQPSHHAAAATSMNPQTYHNSTVVSTNHQFHHTAAAVMPKNQPSHKTAAVDLMDQPPYHTPTVAWMNRVALMKQPSHHAAALVSTNKPSYPTRSAALMNFYGVKALPVNPDKQGSNLVAATTFESVWPPFEDSLDMQMDMEFVKSEIAKMGFPAEQHLGDQPENSAFY